MLRVVAPNAGRSCTGMSRSRSKAAGPTPERCSEPGEAIAPLHHALRGGAGRYDQVVAVAHRAGDADGALPLSRIVRSLRAWGDDGQDWAGREAWSGSPATPGGGAALGR